MGDIVCQKKQPTDAEYLDYLIIRNKNLEQRIKRLEAVEKWVRHLLADMADELPTHYNSYFGLVNALKSCEPQATEEVNE